MSGRVDLIRRRDENATKEVAGLGIIVRVVVTARRDHDIRTGCDRRRPLRVEQGLRIIGIVGIGNVGIKAIIAAADGGWMDLIEGASVLTQIERAHKVGPVAGHHVRIFDYGNSDALARYAVGTQRAKTVHRHHVVRRQAARRAAIG